MRVAWVLGVIAIGVALTPLGSAANQAASAFSPRVFARGFESPVLITQAPGEPNTHYVVEQNGRILKLRGGGRTVFLDIRSDVIFGGEQGLLGLAFHPNYERNRLLYVGYTSDDGRNVVERFRSNGRVAVRSTRAQAACRPGPVRKPQRRQRRVRAGRAPVHVDRGRRAPAATPKTGRRTCARASASC